MEWVKYGYSGWIVSGALLGVSFIYPPVWILGVIGGMWFVVLVRHERRFRQGLFGAWLSWTAKSLFTLWWIISVYPIEWLPVGLSDGQLGVIILCWLASAASVGCGGVGVYLLYRGAQKIPALTSNWRIHGILAVCWLGGEVLGSLMYSVLSFGPGGGFNINFGFGYAGYLLSEHELLLPLAQYAGVYGLSLLFGVLVSVLAAWAARQSLRLYVVLVMAVLYGTSFAFPAVAGEVISPNVDSTTHYQVALIETDYSSEMYRSYSGQRQIKSLLYEAMEVAMAQGVNYILLSEGAGYFDQSVPASSERNKFATKYSDPEVIVVDSGQIKEEQGLILQSYIYNSQTTGFERVHKGYLVPQGEYISYAFLWLAGLMGYGEDIQRLIDQMSYRVGDQVDQSILSQSVPGVLFCLESVSPMGVRNIVGTRPTVPFVAHPISHAWFHKPHSLWNQQAAMLRVQAVWNDVYIVMAANQAVSSVVTPAGFTYVGEVVAEGGGWKVRRVSIPKS